MSIPTFNNKDKLLDVRTKSLNPLIEKVNELETGYGVRVEGQMVQDLNVEGNLTAVVENSAATLYYNTKVSPWPIKKVPLQDLPISILREDQLGIEYEFDGSSPFTKSVLLFKTGLPEGAQIKITLTNVSKSTTPVEVTQFHDLRASTTWPVITPTVFTLREGLWRVEESSQMFHVDSTSSFNDAEERSLIHGIAVDTDSGLNSTVTPDGLLVLSSTNSGGGGGGNYVEKYKNAQINHLEMSYQGKFGENAPFKPVTLYQDANGWTQCEFTGNNVFKSKDMETGDVGDKVLELKASKVVALKKLEALKNLEVTGSLSSQSEDGDLSFYVSPTENLTKFFLPVRMEDTLDLNKNSGTVLQVNRGAVKFWSSGAIELPNYTAFKEKELVTKEYVDNAVADSGGGSSYSGQGLGVPEGAFLVTGTINQSEPVGLYYNALNDGSSRGNIELNNDEGYNEFQVIIQGLNKPTRDWRIGTGTPGRYSDKTIRPGETWLCRVYVDWNASSNTNFFWQRIDDGSGLFTTDEDVRSIVRESLTNHEMKIPFTNQASVEVDVSHLDHPSVHAYIYSEDGIHKVKPAVNHNYLHDKMVVSFVKPKTGLIIIRSQ